MMTTLSTMVQPLLLATTTASLYAFGIKPSEKPENGVTTLIQKVGRVASGIFKAAVSLFHYWVNPTVATIAFFATIIWAKEAEELAARVSSAWQAQPWSFAALSFAAAALSLPVALVTGTVFWACSMGLTLARSIPVENTSDAVPYTG